VAYVIERAGRAGTRYVGIYRTANGMYKSAGTYDSHERAYEVAEDEERHARGFLEETSPSGKATMTISEFCEQRFLRYDAVSPGTLQGYGYVAKNHILPYIGHLRISEVSRETFFNLLVTVLPAEEASQITVRATLFTSHRSLPGVAVLAGGVTSRAILHPRRHRLQRYAAAGCRLRQRLRCRSLRPRARWSGGGAAR
jgi:hypothetical protein